MASTKLQHTPEQLAEVLKAFWTQARKDEMRAWAILHPLADGTPNWGGAMKAVWDTAGAREENTSTYIKVVGGATK
jgi:hypothetical protein